MKNKKVIIIILVLLVTGIISYRWFGLKMERVDLGLANPNFPYQNYIQDELDELYPQIKYANVPTRVTPEETYAKFREALKNNDLEMAIAQLSGEAESYNKLEKMLKVFYDDGKFTELYGYYPSEIKESNIGGSLAQYDFEYYSSEYNQNLTGTISFVKGSEGDWKLSSL